MINKIIVFFSDIKLFLFILIVFTLPFNGFPYFKNIFHELSNELSFYPLYVLWILFGFHFIKTRKIFLPKDKSFYILILLFIWILMSGVYNFEGIKNSFFKSRAGINRFLLQFLVFTFVSISSFIFYNIFKKHPVDEIFIKVRKVIFYSFCVILFFGFWEYLKKFIGIHNTAENIRELLTIGFDGYQDRLHSICGEPSWFGVYLTFGLPWILSFFIERIKLGYLLLYYLIVIFTFFTFSRFSSAVLIVQVFIFLVLFLFKNTNYKKGLFIVIFIFIPTIVLNLWILTSLFSFNPRIKQIPVTTIKQTPFATNEYFKISNQTRTEMQKIGFEIGMDNPVFGVGLGQFGFNFSKYVKDDLKNNPEIKTYLNEKDKFWPPTHGLFSRLFAETGFVGLILWFFLWGYVFIKTLKLLKNDKG